MFCSKCKYLLEAEPYITNFENTRLEYTFRISHLPLNKSVLFLSFETLKSNDFYNVLK